jgi:hypothetical protein
MFRLYLVINLQNPGGGDINGNDTPSSINNDNGM